MESLLIASVTFIGAEVARKVADDAMCAAWATFRSAWLARFGSAPKPEEVSKESLSSLGESTSQLVATLAQSPLLARMKRVGDVLSGARILWIDDHPQWNEWEISFLEAAGANVRTVETTGSALALVASGFDLVISDIDRAGNASEGIEALPALKAVSPQVSVLFYVGDTSGRGVPAGAFGVADRPEPLLHLVIDVLERSRL